MNQGDVVPSSQSLQFDTVALNCGVPKKHLRELVTNADSQTFSCKQFCSRIQKFVFVTILKLVGHGQHFKKQILP